MAALVRAVVLGNVEIDASKVWDMFRIKKFLKRLYNRYFFYPFVWRRKLDKSVERLGQKDCITIAFITMNVAMWKYQSLYDLLKQNPRFKLYIVLSPSVKFSHEEMCLNVQQMRLFFQKRNMEFIDWEIEKNLPPVDIKKEISPDVLFYSQPYPSVFTKLHSFANFQDCLLGYLPYGFLTLNNKVIYNQKLANIAWKVYYSTPFQYNLARKYADNRASNVVISGYSDYDRYISESSEDPWKTKSRSLKRVIWAPHFTISKPSLKGFTPRSNFLEMADFMLDLAKKNPEAIQIAFKPHPRLLSELYKHPNWGKEKADSYFEQWENLPNGQVETGDFVNLFRYSDAMIHDSGSFVVDYMYFGKPQLFVTKDINIQKQESDKLANMIFDSIYTGQSKKDILHFVNEVVLSGNDNMALQRKEIVNKYLLPPNGKMASENIYGDLVASLRING